MIAELNRVVKDGFFADELKAAVKKIELETKNGQRFATQNTSLAYRYQDYYLDGALALSPEKEVELTIKLLNEIQPNEVNQGGKIVDK